MNKFASATVAALCAESSIYGVVIEHILNRLTKSVVLRNAYPLLFAFEYAVFGVSVKVGSAQLLLVRSERMSPSPVESDQIFRVVACHICRLMNFAPSIQSALGLDASSRCLWVQVAVGNKDPASLSAQLCIILLDIFYAKCVEKSSPTECLDDEPFATVLFLLDIPQPIASTSLV